MPRRIYVWLILKEIWLLIHPQAKEQLDTDWHNIPTASPPINAMVKRGIKKKGDGPKFNDKDSNTGGTAGAHVEDTTTPEESIAPSRRANKGAHIFETNKQLSCPLRTIEEILRVYLMSNDDLWGGNGPGDVSINTATRKEMMTGSYIMELHTHKCEEPPELLIVILNEPQAYDSAQNYQLDSLNKSNDLNISSKTNNMIYAKGIDLLSQENQDYYNWRDQQSIAHKYDKGLEQVTIKLVLKIILEERENGFYQGAGKYDQWDNNPYTPVEGNATRGSHTFNTDNNIFNLANTKHNRKPKTRIVSEVSTSNIKLDFYIGKHQS